jgi:hypothetical protein
MTKYALGERRILLLIWKADLRKMLKDNQILHGLKR